MTLLLAPVTAQDPDGWRPREHVAFVLGKDHEELHNLIRKHMVMPFITGDFFAGHLEEVAGGKYFPFEKPNADDAPVDVRCIVIGFTWRQSAASLAVAKSSTPVAEYLRGQYVNFLQLQQKHGATRCAQIVQLLLANHVNHDVSNPLVAVQLHASLASCSILRQPKIDVSSDKSSCSYHSTVVECRIVTSGCWAKAPALAVARSAPAGTVSWVLSG